MRSSITLLCRLPSSSFTQVLANSKARQRMIGELGMRDERSKQM
jgi:hypothetical protein